MTHWKSRIDPAFPGWDDYRQLLGALPDGAFPNADTLNALLPQSVKSNHGPPIRFVPSGDLPVGDYERRIFETGQISTREDNWHDLFNALAWCRFPRLKAAMNAMHYGKLGSEKDGRRGKVRDALTLLDESGVIVAGSNPEVLRSLVNRDWPSVFITHRPAWREEMKVLVCGHAILEKFLDPYKSLTAHALVLYAPGHPSAETLDGLLSEKLGRDGMLRSSADLSPLPLMGIPGWWAGSAQDQSFYHDREVFRPAASHHVIAPIHDPGHLENPG
jgi:hypothetical protein